MPCTVNCTCKVCGRVRLHVSKTPRRSKKPRPVDHAALAVQDALRAMAAPAKGER
jgi:hypothetical protein